MRVKQFVIALFAITMLAATAYAGGTADNAMQDHNPVIQNDRGRDSATIRTNSNLFAEGGRGTLTIENKASFDVIIFAGRVSNNNVMGGIRAGRSRTFDLSRMNLPGRNGSFLIRAVALSTFNERTTRNVRISDENDVVYTGLVVYNLNDPNDRTNINIFAGVSQNQTEGIWVSNYSRFVLELRVNNPNGEKLATLAPATTNMFIPLTARERNMPYEFYATYVYVNPRTNEISSFSPRGMEERQRRTPSSDRVNPMVFRNPEDMSQISYLVSFVRIKNNTNQSFHMMDGTTWLFDQKGIPLVESGMQVTYELPSLRGTQGQEYGNLNMEFDNLRTLQLDRFPFRPGVVYDITIDRRADGSFYASRIQPGEQRNMLDELQMTLLLEG